MAKPVAGERHAGTEEDAEIGARGEPALAEPAIAPVAHGRGPGIVGRAIDRDAAPGDSPVVGVGRVQLDPATARGIRHRVRAAVGQDAEPHPATSRSLDQHPIVAAGEVDPHLLGVAMVEAALEVGRIHRAVPVPPGEGDAGVAPILAGDAH